MRVNLGWEEEEIEGERVKIELLFRLSWSKANKDRPWRLEQSG